MNRIRYSYRKSKEGFRLDKVKCPVCDSNHINWIKVIEHTSWSGKVGLLAECWSGDTRIDKPHHLFRIRMADLPIVNIEKVKFKKKEVTPKGERE